MSESLEELKRLIHELKEAGDDERLDVEDYVQLCMDKVERAYEICTSLESQEIAKLDTEEVLALHGAAEKMRRRAEASHE